MQTASTTSAQPAQREYRSYGVTPEPPVVAEAGRYGVIETARKLGVHRNTVTKFFNNGHLKPIDPMAPKLRFSGKEIMRFWRWKTLHG